MRKMQECIEQFYMYEEGVYDNAPFTNSFFSNTDPTVRFVFKVQPLLDQ